MKRVFIFLGVLLILSGLPALAQDSTAPSGPAPSTTSTASEIAAREGADEKYKRMAADVEALQAANDALQSKLTAMEQEIQTLREAQTHAPDNSGIQDDLKHLADKIQEVDKKREDDKQVISEEIRKSIGGLEKTMSSPPPSTHISTPRASANTDAAPVGNGYSYTIQQGDSLLAILKAYNTDFKSKGLKSITFKQAREANPNVDWNRLRVGQKIVIPRPDGG